MTIELSSTRTSRIRSCSTIPACSNASTKARLEPSQPGHSAASISTTQLSTCMPARAAITCSVISTVASPSLIVVRRRGDDPIDPCGHPGTTGQVGPFEDDARAGLGRPEAKRDVRPVEEPLPTHQVAWASVRCRRLACCIPCPFSSLRKRRDQFWSVCGVSVVRAGWRRAGRNCCRGARGCSTTALYRRLRL